MRYQCTVLERTRTVRNMKTSLIAGCVLLFVVAVMGECGCLQCSKHLRVVSPPASPVKVIYRGSPCHCPRQISYTVETPVIKQQPCQLNNYCYKMLPIQLSKPVQQVQLYSHDYQVQVPKQPCKPISYLVGLVAQPDRIVLPAQDCPSPPSCGCPKTTTFESVNCLDDDNVYLPPYKTCTRYVRYKRNVKDTKNAEFSSFKRCKRNVKEKEDCLGCLNCRRDVNGIQDKLVDECVSCRRDFNDGQECVSCRRSTKNGGDKFAGIIQENNAKILCEKCTNQDKFSKEISKGFIKNIQAGLVQQSCQRCKRDFHCKQGKLTEETCEQCRKIAGGNQDALSKEYFVDKTCKNCRTNVEGDLSRLGEEGRQVYTKNIVVQSKSAEETREKYRSDVEPEFVQKAYKNIEDCLLGITGEKCEQHQNVSEDDKIVKDCKKSAGSSQEKDEDVEKQRRRNIRIVNIRRKCERDPGSNQGCNGNNEEVVGRNIERSQETRGNVEHKCEDCKINTSNNQDIDGQANNGINFQKDQEKGGMVKGECGCRRCIEANRGLVECCRSSIFKMKREYDGCDRKEQKTGKKLMDVNTKHDEGIIEACKSEDRCQNKENIEDGPSNNYQQNEQTAAFSRGKTFVKSIKEKNNFRENHVRNPTSESQEYSSKIGKGLPMAEANLESISPEESNPNDIQFMNKPYLETKPSEQSMIACDEDLSLNNENSELSVMTFAPQEISSKVSDHIQLQSPPGGEEQTCNSATSKCVHKTKIIDLSHSNDVKFEISELEEENDGLESTAGDKDQSRNSPDAEVNDGIQLESTAGEEDQSCDSPAAEEIDGTQLENIAGDEDQSCDSPAAEENDGTQLESTTGDEDKSHNSPDAEVNDGIQLESTAGDEDQSCDSPAAEENDDTQLEITAGDEDHSHNSPDAEVNDGIQLESIAGDEDQSCDSPAAEEIDGTQLESTAGDEDQSHNSPDAEVNDGIQLESTAGDEDQSHNSPDAEVNDGIQLDSTAGDEDQSHNSPDAEVNDGIQLESTAGDEDQTCDSPAAEENDGTQLQSTAGGEDQNHNSPDAKWANKTNSLDNSMVKFKKSETAVENTTHFTSKHFPLVVDGVSIKDENIQASEDMLKPADKISLINGEIMTRDDTNFEFTRPILDVPSLNTEISKLDNAVKKLKNQAQEDIKPKERITSLNHRKILHPVSVPTRFENPKHGENIWPEFFLPGIDNLSAVTKYSDYRRNKRYKTIEEENVEKNIREIFFNDYSHEDQRRDILKLPRIRPLFRFPLGRRIKRGLSKVFQARKEENVEAERKRKSSLNKLKVNRGFLGKQTKRDFRVLKGGALRRRSKKVRGKEGIKHIFPKDQTKCDFLPAKERNGFITKSSLSRKLHKPDNFPKNRRFQKRTRAKLIKGKKILKLKPLQNGINKLPVVRPKHSPRRIKRDYNEIYEIRGESSLKPSDIFYDSINWDDVIPQIPLFFFINAPIRMLKHFDKLKDHLEPVVDCVPTVIDTSRKYIQNFGRKFKRSAVSFANNIFGGFAKTTFDHDFLDVIDTHNIFGRIYKRSLPDHCSGFADSKFNRGIDKRSFVNSKEEKFNEFLEIVESRINPSGGVDILVRNKKIKTGDLVLIYENYTLPDVQVYLGRKTCFEDDTMKEMVRSITDDLQDEEIKIVYAKPNFDKTGKDQIKSNSGYLQGKGRHFDARPNSGNLQREENKFGDEGLQQDEVILYNLKQNITNLQEMNIDNSGAAYQLEEESTKINSANLQRKVKSEYPQLNFDDLQQENITNRFHQPNFNHIEQEETNLTELRNSLYSKGNELKEVKQKVNQNRVKRSLLKVIQEGEIMDLLREKLSYSDDQKITDDQSEDIFEKHFNSIPKLRAHYEKPDKLNVVLQKFNPNNFLRHQPETHDDPFTILQSKHDEVQNFNPETNLQVIKNEVTRILETIHVLIQTDFNQDIKILNSLLKLQIMKDNLTADWKKTLLEGKEQDSKIKLKILQYIKELSRYKKNIMHSIVQQLQNRNTYNRKNLIDILIQLFKIQLVFTNITEDFSEKIKTGAKFNPTNEASYITHLNKIKIIESEKNEIETFLKTTRDDQLQKQMQILEKLKTVLDHNDLDDVIREEINQKAILIRENLKLAKLQKTAIRELNSRSQHLRRKLKSVHDLQTHIDENFVELLGKEEDVEEAVDEEEKPKGGLKEKLEEFVKGFEAKRDAWLEKNKINITWKPLL